MKSEKWKVKNEKWRVKNQKKSLIMVNVLYSILQGRIRAKISGTAAPNVCPNEFCVPIKVISNISQLETCIFESNWVTNSAN